MYIKKNSWNCFIFLTYWFFCMYIVSNIAGSQLRSEKSRTAALFASSAFKNQNWRKQKKFFWDGRIQRTNSRTMTSWFWARCKETWWDFDEVVHMHMMGELLISNSWPGLYNTLLPLPMIGHIWFKWKIGVFKCGQRIIQDLLYLTLYTAQFSKIIQPPKKIAPRAT